MKRYKSLFEAEIGFYKIDKARAGDKNIFVIEFEKKKDAAIVDKLFTKNNIEHSSIKKSSMYDGMEASIEFADRYYKKAMNLLDKIFGEEE